MSDARVDAQSRPGGGVPAKNTLDRATALLQRLLYELLDEWGFDFTVLYPTLGLRMPFIPDSESRRIACFQSISCRSL